jgi:phosphatidate cytidylyltransferase
MNKKQIFFARLLSTVVLWVAVLWAILSGKEIGFLIVIGGLGLVALWEYYLGAESHGLHVFRYVGMACGALMLIGSFLVFSGQFGPSGGGFERIAYDFDVGALILSLFVIFVRQMFQKTLQPRPLRTMAYTFFGVVYVAWMFSFVYKIVFLLPREAGQITGNWYVLFLCVVSKFSDMGAYLTGSLIGRHPLVPHISPKKTWEGFLGALLFSVGGSFALCALMPKQFALLNSIDALVLGLGLGFAAVVGDLGESIIKRSLEIKDSGKMLPGIGGALDLIDSVLFTAPILYFYLRLVHQLR